MAKRQNFEKKKMAKFLKIRELPKNRGNFKNEIEDSDWWIIAGYSWNNYFM